MEQNTTTAKRTTQYVGAKPSQVAILMIISAVVSAALVVLLLLSGATRYRLADAQGEYDATLISTLLEEIDKYYYFSDEAPESDELLENAAKVLVSDIGDPYAEYYTEDEYTAFRNEMDGNYKGIGVLVGLAEDGSGLFVTRAYVGNPAYEAGVRDGDIITSVNGESLEGINIDDASAMLLGEDGSFATIDVKRGEEHHTFTVMRSDVHVSQVFSEKLENNIGYICIEAFTGDAADAFNNHLKALLDAGITSLIIDVRNNPGGSLDVVIDICDRILPEGLIMTIEGKLCNPPVEYKSTDKEKLEIPYVVLVNSNSASASEVFASAVQDNEEAKIIGKTTFGKGIVQTSWSLGEGIGYIKMTTDAYRTPNGNLIHGIGVIPDIEVEQVTELEGVDPYFTMRDARDMDMQLKAAIDLLMGK